MIKTERLILKRMSERDRENVKAILINKDVKKTYMIPDLETEEEITKMFKRLKKLSCSRKCYLVGVYYEKALIGFINQVETDGKNIELGYVIHPYYHNRGFATEALGVVIDDLFEKGYSRVIAGAFEENPASIKVMKKCGMRKIKKEEDIDYRGRMHHCYYYAITKSKN